MKNARLAFALAPLLLWGFVGDASADVAGRNRGKIIYQQKDFGHFATEAQFKRAVGKA